MRRYTIPAIVLHWLIAIGIIGTFTLGLVMTDIQGISMAKIRYTNWHKWAGVTVLALAALRLLWRLFNHPPEYADDMPAWQRGAAHGLHIALYLLMFAVPLSGYFFSLAAGYPVVWFGEVPLPVLIDRDPALRDLLRETHYWLNMLLAALVSLHVLAAFKHLIIDRDGVMQRMLPSFARK